MKLNEFLGEAENTESIKARIKELTKELISAKSGGNDDVAENLKGDIAELKDKLTAGE